MNVQLNHTIVAAHDKKASAQFLAVTSVAGATKRTTASTALRAVTDGL